jgi:hypothetical protein
MYIEKQRLNLRVLKRGSMKRIYQKCFVAMTLGLMLWLLGSPLTGQAQTKTISTYPTYQQTWWWWGCIAFNVQNNNPYPVKITGIRSTLDWNGYVEIWSSQTPINGVSPIINTTNGWVLEDFGNVGTYDSYVPFDWLGNPFNIVVPAYSTIALAIYGDEHWMPNIGSVTTFTTDGVSLLFGNGNSYGEGAPQKGLYTDQAMWIGQIDFEPMGGSSQVRNDASVIELVEPTQACAGINPLKVKIGNRGTNDITYLRVDYEVNGVRQQGFTITNPLYKTGSTTGASDSVLYLTNVNVQQGGTKVKVWTSNPNQMTDTVNSNDTLEVTLNPGLEGTYTINPYSAPSATNFQSFTSFCDIIDSFGICGHVVVNVSPGTYTGAVKLNKLKTGPNATITFNGGGQAYLSFNSSDATNPATININETPYVTFDGFHVRNFTPTTSSYGGGLHITKSDYVTFKNGSIYVDSNYNSSNRYTMTISGSTMYPGNSDGHSHNMTLENNELVGGYYSIYVYGYSSSSDTTSNLVIRNNKIRNFGYMSAYMYYVRDMDFSYNDISRPDRTNNTSMYPFYSYYCNRVKIAYNFVHDLFNPNMTGYTYDYGFYVYYSYGEPGKWSEVYNNIHESNVGYYAYGLRLYYTRYLKAYNNTIIYNENPNSQYQTTWYGFYPYTSNSTTYRTNEYYNNNIYIQRKPNGTAATYVMYYYDGAQGITSANRNYCDRNNYFVTGGTGAKYWYNGTSYTTFASYQSAQMTRGHDSNSVSVDPQFASLAFGSIDATPANTALRGIGKTPNFFNDDIKGQGRPAAPTLGAIEMNPTNCVVPVQLLAYNVTNNSATISWRAISGVSGYEYAYNTTGTPPTSGTSTTATSVNLTGLTNNTLYYYFVRTRCSGGNSGWNMDTFRTFTNACNPPSTLTINAGSTSATVSWTNSTSTSNHQYVISTSPSIPTRGFSTTTSGQFANNSLNPNTKYYVFVRAYCSANQQSIWRIDSFQTCFVNQASLTPGTWHGCTNDTVVLIAPGHSSYTYQWYNNGSAISGATNSVLVVTNTGKYSARMVSTVSSACSRGTDTLDFVVHTRPTVTVDTVGGGNSFCFGDSMALAAGYQHGYSYQWYIGHNPLSGETGDTLVIKNTGLYKVVVEANGCKDSSELIYVAAITVPNTSLTISGPLEFCEGGSVQIIGTPLFGATYQWYRDGQPATNGSGSTVIATESGKYVLHTNITPCSGYSAEVDVKVNPKPVSTITYVGNNVLTAPAGYNNYQWYFNGTKVGTNSNTYNAGTNYGFYYVTVVDSNGCEGTSLLYDHQPTRVNDVSTSISLQVYPNPSNGKVMIESSIPVVYDVLSVDGKMILTQQSDKSFDISSYANGIYTIRIYNEQGSLISVHKLTKE